MAGQELHDVQVSWHGLAGDRRSGTPFLSVQRRPSMLRYRPWFVEPDRPDSSRTMVRCPSGQEYDVVDPALAVELGGGVRVLKLDRGVFDALPLSVITTQTVDAVGALVGSKLGRCVRNPGRFTGGAAVERNPHLRTARRNEGGGHRSPHGGLSPVGWFRARGMQAMPTLGGRCSDRLGGSARQPAGRLGSDLARGRSRVS
jgi:hypothetical protein